MQASKHVIQENCRKKNFHYYSAELFHQRRVQRDFFFKWKRIAAEHVIIRAADNLHRLHTLKKGMDAFKWAINRSRIMVDIYQNKLKGVLMSATFYKVRMMFDLHSVL